MSGRSAVNGQNADGAANSGANRNRMTTIAGSTIEKKSNNTIFAHLNSTVLSDESWLY